MSAWRYNARAFHDGQSPSKNVRVRTERPHHVPHTSLARTRHTEPVPSSEIEISTFLVCEQRFCSVEKIAPKPHVCRRPSRPARSAERSDLASWRMPREQARSWVASVRSAEMRGCAASDFSRFARRIAPGHRAVGRCTSPKEAPLSSDASYTSRSGCGSALHLCAATGRVHTSTQETQMLAIGGLRGRTMETMGSGRMTCSRPAQVAHGAERVRAHI